MEQNQFNHENETPLFEGQPIEQPQVVNTVETQMFETSVPVQDVQVEQPIPQQAENFGFTQETPMSEPFSGTDTQMYQTPQFGQEQSEVFGQPQPAPMAPLTQPQASGFGPVMVQGAPKSNKKMITIIVSSVLAAVLLLLGGLYGFSVYSKMQAVETLKNERNSLKKQSDEVQKQVSKLDALDKLQEFEICMNGSSLNRGEAFNVSLSTGSFVVEEVAESKIKEGIDHCKTDVQDLSFDGAKEVTDAAAKKMEDGYKENAQYMAEAKTIVGQWNEFKAAWKTGTAEAAEFNRVRDLAGKAMGVDPASLGSTSLSYYDITMAVYTRIKTVEYKQKTVRITEVSDFISKNSDGVSGDIEVELGNKKDEQSSLKKKLDQKEKDLKEKESKVWIPFQ